METLFASINMTEKDLKSIFFNKIQKIIKL